MQPKAPLTVFSTDVGGAGAAPPAAPPSAPTAPADPGAAGMAILDAAANAEFDASQAPAATTEPAGGTPPAAPPAAGEPDDLDFGNVDFENLSYRDGKALEDRLVRIKRRVQPFETALKSVPDEHRDAVTAALNAPDALALLTANPNDRAILADAYQTFLVEGQTNPEAAAAKFRAIADQIAPPDGNPATPPAPPAGGAAPVPGEPDPDAPMTWAQYQAAEAARQQQADQTRQQADSQAAMLAQLRDLGYDPDSSDPAVRSQADEVIWLAAYRTEGDFTKAHAEVEARRQAIIDRYVTEKRTYARTPGTPETGTASNGAVDPNTLSAAEKAEGIFAAELGPDRNAYQG